MPIHGQRGSSTAEMAVLLPAAAALLAVALGAGAAAATQVRLEQAARAAARELARGEDPARAATTARRLAGPGSRVDVGADGGFRTVTVSGPLDWPALAGLGPLQLEASAHARAETGGGAPGAP